MHLRLRSFSPSPNDEKHLQPTIGCHYEHHLPFRVLFEAGNVSNRLRVLHDNEKNRTI